MIYLASRSPRRRVLLDQIGVRYRTLAVDVPESQLAGEAPDAYVCRLAREKAEQGFRRVPDSARSGSGRRRQPPAGTPAAEPVLVLGADTTVVLGGEILGKPEDPAHARDLLGRLSGRRHEVLTAVALAGGSQGVRLSVSRVWFRRLSAPEREAYCASGEPLDKAGGYAIQGRAAAFVRRLDGSYSGVMGLPLFETAELLREAGIDVLAGG